jgi:uncharacterized protein
MNGNILFGLPITAVEKIRGVFANWPQIEKVILYGSRAKGNFKNGSDIDLTMLGAGLDLCTLLKVDDELDELLLPWMIDLSIYDQINNVALREHIERVGKIFYEKRS